MPLRFTFRQLEYMVAVGDAGTIALASQRINVSSPSISAAISQLEREFGIQLFVRHHAQGLTLTPGGQRIFNEAKRILEEHHDQLITLAEALLEHETLDRADIDALLRGEEIKKDDPPEPPGSANPSGGPRASIPPGGRRKPTTDPGGDPEPQPGA